MKKESIKAKAWREDLNGRKGLVGRKHQGKACRKELKLEA
jgi:hypothetical protein